MKCTHCGAFIPDEMLICPECGTEVQIVPDYNPLEDVLAQEVRGGVHEATRPIRTGDIRKYTNRESRKPANSTRIIQPNDIDRIRSRHSDYEQRRRQQVLRKKRAKRRLQRFLMILFLAAALIGVIIFLGYQNSYDGIMRKGNQALGAQQFSEAESYFKRAIAQNAGRAEAYIGLSKIYLHNDDLEGAENIFLDAIDAQPTNTALYKAVIQFYIDTDQLIKISRLLDDTDDEKVLQEVREYISEPPVFSLDDGIFQEVQEVALTSNGETIFYTTDGSEPTTASNVYTEPILINEGENTIKAISVNRKGIPSLTSARTFVVDLPIAGAPAVSPSTGQYNRPTQITIQVPEGYTAFYTMDGTMPTTASNQYTGPIDMPEGRTMFWAILVNNSNGKATPATQRNYVLELN